VPPTVSWAICSPVCDAARKKRRFEEANGKAYGLPTGTVGALHELTVAVDLLRRGYAVFRALSPTCGCDLAVLKGRDLLRVEVKSAYRGRSGNLILGITKKDRPSARFEILALVERSGRITYLDSARNEVDLGGPTPTVFGP
jgi:hypothetical protein